MLLFSFKEEVIPLLFLTIKCSVYVSIISILWSLIKCSLFFLLIDVTGQVISKKHSKKQRFLLHFTWDFCVYRERPYSKCFLKDKIHLFKHFDIFSSTQEQTYSTDNCLHKCPHCRRIQCQSLCIMWTRWKYIDTLFTQ